MLRLFFFLVCIFLSTSAGAVTDYELDVILLPEAHQLIATATLKIEGTAGPEFLLDLDENCTIVAIHQTGNALPFQFTAGQLSFRTQSVDPISISYSGIFYQSLENLPGHNEDPSYEISASISSVGTFLSAGVDWYPRPKEDTARYQISIHSQPGTVAVTSGRRLKQQTTPQESLSIWEIDYPLSGITLSAGDYQIVEDLTGSVPVYAYFYPGSTALAPGYLKEARRYLDLYQGLFGPYPFHKFAIVENFFPTGYGLPSWTLLGSTVIALPFIVKSSLGHEIAHSWWGNGVKVDYSQGNWAEGLTTYVADHLYQEQETSAKAIIYRQTILRNFSTLIDSENDFPLNSFLARNNKSSQAIGYGKAAMVFHMLRTLIGEGPFWQGLQQIARQHMFNTIDWDVFAEVFSSISGQNLQYFFDQWLSRSSGPSLRLDEVKLQSADTGWEVSGKLVQQPPPFRLRIDLLLTSESEEEVKKPIVLQMEETPFLIFSPRKPTGLVADPQVDLFRVLAAAEIPSTVNSIRGSDRLMILTSGRNAPGATAQKALMSGLRKSSLPMKSWAEVAHDDLAKHDLLIFGTPETLLPKGVSLTESGNQLQLPGQVLPLASHSVFLVGRNPFNCEHHASWFISGDSAHDVTVARKIPHYGKYSYLVFSGEENQKKEIREPQESPLRVSFP